MSTSDTWRWYLALGGLSLLKAFALRDNHERFRRELLDAGLFVGLGLLLHRLETGQGRTGNDRSAGLRTGTIGNYVTGERVVHAIDAAVPVIRESVMPAIVNRFGGEESEKNRLEHLRRRLPA